MKRPQAESTAKSGNVDVSDPELTVSEAEALERVDQRSREIAGLTDPAPKHTIYFIMGKPPLRVGIWAAAATLTLPWLPHLAGEVVFALLMLPLWLLTHHHPWRALAAIGLLVAWLFFMLYSHEMGGAIEIIAAPIAGGIGGLLQPNLRHARSETPA